jgi:hypothetical protein
MEKVWSRPARLTPGAGGKGGGYSYSYKYDVARASEPK